MEMLRVLGDPILPVFAVLALGVAMGRAGLMTDADARLINRLAMTVLLPLLIFGMVADAPIASFALAPLLIYGAVELTLGAAVFALLRAAGAGAAEALLLALSAVFANNAFVVIPISMLLYGPDTILPITAIVTWDTVVLFPAALAALEMIARGRGQWRGVAAGLIRSPLILAVLAGLGWNATGQPLPAPVATFAGFVGAAAAPVGLFALGLILAGIRFRADAAVAAVSGVQLVLFPLAVWGALAFWRPGEPSLGLFVLGAAGPSSTAPFSIALLYGVRTDRVAQVLIWTAAGAPLVLAVLA